TSPTTKIPMFISEAAMTLPRNWEKLSLDQLYWTLNDPRRHPTPQSTVEALMYSLRERGVAALSEPDCRRRLSELSDDQMREVATRLQKLKPEIAPAWGAEQIEMLFKTKAQL